MIRGPKTNGASSKTVSDAPEDKDPTGESAQQVRC